MRWTLQATDIAGIRTFAVYAKDDGRRYYERFWFVAAASDPFHLFVLMKDLRQTTKGD